MDEPQQQQLEQQQEQEQKRASQASCSIRCFSEVTPADGRLDFQIIDLGRQVYVWVAVGGAKLSNLCFSIQSPTQASRPVCTCGTHKLMFIYR